jgi:hypothetical protein
MIHFPMPSQSNFNTDSNIRVSGADLAKINKTSIPMPGEEDSYWVELSVVHELHCIVSLFFTLRTLI